MFGYLHHRENLTNNIDFYAKNCLTENCLHTFEKEKTVRLIYIHTYVYIYPIIAEPWQRLRSQKSSIVSCVAITENCPQIFDRMVLFQKLAKILQTCGNQIIY